MSVPLEDDLYSSLHSYNEIVPRGKKKTSCRRDKTTSIAAEIIAVQKKTSFHKYSGLKLVVPGSELEKWYQIIQILSEME